MRAGAIANREASSSPPLLVPPRTSDPGTLLQAFLNWVASTGLTPYPAQEEALLELYAGRHVALNTPTGSGKTLVATGLQFKALGEGARAFYTAPIKALVSEKFFDLCRLFGADQVGMLTGDASINHDAPLVCCTAEILANMAIAQSEGTLPQYVVMDEFHYYADRDRGSAWQVPLITMRRAQFLLMSATMGDTREIAQRLADHTGREVAHVDSLDRPVPLTFEYRETPLHQTIEILRNMGRLPAYVVSFTQRECAELAQGLTSLDVVDAGERRRIAERVGQADMSTPYGREVGRLLRTGIGLHHAGLLPRYRLLVEQLAQDGLLKVICGTDTLGMGVNIPIRTVVFAKLAKYDGHKVALLTARDFHQIAGRAGRKGFDDRGTVVAQAPGHVVRSRQKAEKFARASAKGRRGKPPRRSGAPKGSGGPRDEVTWNHKTFEQLVNRRPEPLVSRMRVTHHMVITALQRGRDGVDGDRSGGYAFLVRLLLDCHEEPRRRKAHLVRGAGLLRSLRTAGIAVVTSEPGVGGRLALADDLQLDFSLHQAPSLYLVDAVGRLDPGAVNHALDVLSLVEAIIPGPRVVLFAQENRAKRALLDRLKDERVPYDERMAQLDKVSWPKPLAEFIEATVVLFATTHPWLGRADVEPKSIARELLEGDLTFADYVRRYELQRSEGTLLRYLGEVYKALARSIPETDKTDALLDVEATLRVIVQRVDASLLNAWSRLLDMAGADDLPEMPPEEDLARDPKALAARVRAELHQLVLALAAGDYEEAARCVWQPPAAGAEDAWTAERLEEALAPFRKRYGAPVADHTARRTHHTVLRPAGARRWEVMHSLVSRRGDAEWAVHGRVDLTRERDPLAPIVRVVAIEG